MFKFYKKNRALAGSRSGVSSKGKMLEIGGFCLGVLSEEGRIDSVSFWLVRARKFCNWRGVGMSVDVVSALPFQYNPTLNGYSAVKKYHDEL